LLGLKSQTTGANMQKHLQQAILLNVILLLLYVIVDYAIWTNAPSGLSLPWYSGTFEDFDVTGSYNLFSRSVWITGHYRSGTSFEEVSSLPNLTLLLFILALALNTYLIWRTAHKY
jgi:hypothetical protein